jgi:hypothetical protein
LGKGEGVKRERRPEQRRFGVARDQKSDLVRGEEKRDQGKDG